MKKFYISPIKDTEKIPSENYIFSLLLERTDKDTKRAVYFKDCDYALLKSKPKAAEIIGFLYSESISQKDEPVNFKCEKTAVFNGIKFNLYEKNNGKIVGYIYSEKGTVVAVSKERNIYPSLIFFPFLLALVIIFAIIMSPKDNVTRDTAMIFGGNIVFGEDAVSQGCITKSENEPLNPVYFNIKVNATPILEDGQMNIRIENSSQNIYSCHVKITTVVNGQKKEIYNSPLIKPNQSIKSATVSENLPVGVYDGKAIFSYFEGKNQLSVNTVVKLIINVR